MGYYVLGRVEAKDTGEQIYVFHEEDYRHAGATEPANLQELQTKLANYLEREGIILLGGPVTIPHKWDADSELRRSKNSDLPKPFQFLANTYRPFLMKESEEAQAAGRYIKTIKEPDKRIYAQRYFFYLLGYDLKPPSPRPLKEEEARELQVELDKFFQSQGSQYSTTGSPKLTDEQIAGDREPIPFTPVKRLQRDDVLYVTEQTRPHPIAGYSKAHKEYSVIDLRGYRRGYEPRLEIQGIYSPNPKDTFRLQDGHLPPYQPTTTGDKLLSEMRRLGIHSASKIAPAGAISAQTRKYWVLIDKPGDSYFTEGTAVPYEEFEEERNKIIDRGGKPPTIRIRLQLPSGNGNGDKQLPATVEAEPVPEKYRWLIPFIGDEPLPPEANILLPAVEVVEGERKIDVVLKRLAEGVEGIQDSTQFRLFLTTMAKFHDYSYANQILVMLQRPSATRVAGFVTWKDLGRWVKKGESGIAILAPVFPPKPKKEAGEEEEEEEIPLTPVYFRVVHVFDISQTDGKPLPEFEVPVLTGEANEELFGKVLAMAKAQGLEVSFESRPHQDPSIKGEYSAPKSIWVKPEESRAQQLKSLLHEVAHYYSEGVFRTPRRDAETIAESAAFAVGAHYGFDSGVRSFPYVALWAQEKKTLAQNLKTIRRVTDTMLKVLEGTIKQSAEMLTQVADEPSAILRTVWGHLKCRKTKPAISFRRQHSTALYWPDENKITIREDSWRKMHPAERKLIVVHEALHACGAGHEPGFRTAVDSMSTLIYKKIWGEDEDWHSFITELEQRLRRFMAKPSLLTDDELLLTVEFLAQTEGDPISKFCCRFSDACAPPELLEEGKFLERISWLRQHYNEKHPGMWGKQKLLPLAITKGTCYEDAWRFLLKGKEGYLVHGTVYSEGKRIGHAWVETETAYIWEPQTGQFYTKLGFKDIASPVEEHRYDVTEASIMAGRTNHFGPWTDEERGKILKRGQPAVIPTKPSPPSPREELEFISDSPDFIPFTIDQIGYREKLDNAFQSRIAQVQGR